ETARTDYLRIFQDKGIQLTGLTVSGNPLSPLPTEGIPHAHDLRRTIELAGTPGVPDVVAMSGTPGTHEGARYPAWIANPWTGSTTCRSPARCIHATWSPPRPPSSSSWRRSSRRTSG